MDARGKVAKHERGSQAAYSTLFSFFMSLCKLPKRVNYSVIHLHAETLFTIFVLANLCSHFFASSAYAFHSLVKLSK